MTAFYEHANHRPYEIAKAAVLRATAPFRSPASRRRWMRIACQIVDKYATDLTPRQKRAARLFLRVMDTAPTWKLKYAMETVRGQYGFARDVGPRWHQVETHYFGGRVTHYHGSLVDRDGAVWWDGPHPEATCKRWRPNKEY